MNFNIYQKMSDSAVLPSISSASGGNSATTNGLQISFPQMNSTAVSLAQSISSLTQGLKPLQESISENSSNGGASPVPPTSNAVSLMQAAAATQAMQQASQQQQQQQQATGVNQTDYFRNCNVPNLINKWRRRHTWLFLKEGKMFCQACIDFKAVAKRYGRCDERNKFCNEGSTNFRSSAVEDHARSETHLRAVRATSQNDGEGTFQPPLDSVGSGKNTPYLDIGAGISMVPRQRIIDHQPSRPLPNSQLSLAPATTTTTEPFVAPVRDEHEPKNTPENNSPTPDTLKPTVPTVPVVPETSDERIHHLNVMLGKLRQQRSEGILCDVWVRYPNRQIQAHKALLSAASPVLAERLQLDSTKNSVSEIEVTEVKPAIFQQIIDFIYSGEIPANVDTSQLLEAARFLQMKDLIQRLEKFESDLNQLRDLLPSYFAPQAKKNRKRSLPKMSLNNNHRVSPLSVNDAKIAVKLAAFSSQVTVKTESPSTAAPLSSEDIQIEEIGPDDDADNGDTPPAKTVKREATEIEVKVTDPGTPVVTPKPSPISGSSRRKGTSQVRRIAPTVVRNDDAPIDGVEEWLSSSKEGVKQEIF